MANIIKRKAIVFILIWLLLVLFGSTKSQNAKAGETLLSENLAIVLLIDISGSMSRTDPERMRETAAGVFIDLLGPDDYLGIVIFDDKVEVVTTLEQIRGFDNKRDIKERLFPKLDPRGFTDYLGALEKVFQLLQEADTAGAHPVVVFLTDGDPNPYQGSRDDSDFMSGYMNDLWGLIRRFGAERYPIYSVGFGYEILPGVLEKISQDTKGAYYILSSSDELLITFIELVRDLKNRQTIIDETLPSGVEKTYSFIMDEFTRQINLVFASQAEAINVSLFAPDGQPVETGKIPGLISTEDKGSKLVVLHQLDMQYWGEWSFAVSADRPVKIMGDKDYYIQVSIENPVPYSQQPVNEPLDFQVQLNREDAFLGIPLRLEIQAWGPGLPGTVYIPLKESPDGLFTGTFDRLSRPGTFEFEVRVLREDEIVSTNSIKVYAKLIPSMRTDFFTDRNYVAGEENIVTASLYSAGNRLMENRDLQVEEFKIILAHGDGTRDAIAFYDSGNYDEHGDLRARDGIWSNRFSFDKTGQGEAFLIAAGTYRNTEFNLEKRLGNIFIARQGNVYFEIQGSSWGVPGRSISLPLRIESDSDLPEAISIRISGDVAKNKIRSLSVMPGEVKNVFLEIELEPEVVLGEYQLPVLFSAQRESTILNPNDLTVSVTLLSPRAAFWRNNLNFIGVTVLGIVLFIIIFTLLVLVGLFLYRINITPQTKVKGSLFYRPSDSTREVSWQEIKFTGKKNKAIISFNHDNLQADYNIKGSEFSYDIELKALWPSQGPRFIQGLKSMKNKYLPAKIMLRCTPPGLIDYRGKIYTEKELFHEDRFDSGEFSFHYVNPYSKWGFEEKGGIDILGRKFNSDDEIEGRESL